MSDLYNEMLEVLRWYAREHYGFQEADPYCSVCHGSGEEEYEHPHNGDWNTMRCDCTVDKSKERVREEYRWDGGVRARELLKKIEAQPKISATPVSEGRIIED